MVAILMEIQWDLAAIMARKKVSVNELADALDISRTTASRYKNSAIIPGGVDHERLTQICNLLNCTPGELLPTSRDSEDPDPK
ncbi:helix-turn-helix domain-containing protein [Laspinema palackyanum]|uniref:helix-turn-helix domain-containing protein n=1 Tax=Laspinema palackyanum TaxID=3231601 RepID=UPI00349F534F